MMNHTLPVSKYIMFSAVLFALCMAQPAARAADVKELLNVSYDPTREFYEEYNALFAEHWKEETGRDIIIKQSHGGSGKQARSVIEGLRADVVTLALAYDIDMIAHYSKRIPADWQYKLPDHSVPYHSTIVFLVRKGNPKAIRDWDDLIKPDVKVITPNPKTSGGARWNHLAAYGYALKANDKNEDKALEYLTKLYRNVPVLDTGARGATTTFVQRKIGDVLLAWENEAYLAQRELGQDEFEIIVPSVSIRAEPPVAVVDWVAERKGTLKEARDYLEYLYSKPAQELIAKHYFRPADESVKTNMPALELFTINDFGGWEAVQKQHFADDGLFDKAYLP